ncbi:hypothetical protein LBMAG53_20730 [Planctomycetota bacterium]|nr:hypothetical protein LBMAG53_20730 [Planctomycetota bacterium]
MRLPLLIAVLPCLFAAEPDLAQAVRQALTATGLPAGLVVVAGAGDAILASSLADGPQPVLVLALPAADERIRAELAERKLLGRVTVEIQTDPARIPLANDSAAVLVVLAGCSANADERLRVVRPRGRVLADGGAKDKPWPKEYADWGQMAYDGSNSDVSADRAVGPSRSLQWSASDGEQTQNQLGLRLADGILVGLEDKTLVGRDAFSGLCLWRRDDLPVRNRYAFLAVSGRVILRAPKQPHQRALDLATGKDLITYDQGADFSAETYAHVGDKPWARTVAADRVLVQAAQSQLCAVDIATGAKLWSKSGENRTWGLPTVLGRQVVVAIGATTGPSNAYLSGWSAQQVEEIQSFDLRSGQPNWTWKWTATTEPFLAQHLAADPRGYLSLMGHVVQGGDDHAGENGRPIQTQGGHWLTLLDGQGKQLWQQHLNGNSKGHGSNWRTLVLGDTVWSTGLRSAVPLALADGKPLLGVGRGGPKGTDICISYCQPVRATADYLVTMLFTTEPATGRTWRNDAARSACDVGGFPAFGRIFTTTTNCGCQSFLPGLHAFDATEPPATAAPRKARPGPGHAATPLPEADAWPQLARDSRRSRWSTAAVADQPKQIWSWKTEDPLKSLPATLAADCRDQPWRSGPITAPVLAEGIVALAISDLHTVVALDANSGAQRWRAVVTGRVDAPPSIHAGMVLVGTRSGWVVALSREDGREIWRFQAAPADRLILSGGQVESSWPVPGVTLHDGLVWCAAGRHSHADGGLWWWALKPGDGSIVHQGRLDVGQRWFSQEELSKLGGGGGGAAGATNLQRISLNTPFIAQDDGSLLLWSLGIDPATGAPKTGLPGNHGGPSPGERLLRPGQFGLIQTGCESTGLYGRGMSLGGVKGKLIARDGDEFVALFSNFKGSTPQRGGSPATLQAWRITGVGAARDAKDAQGISALVWEGIDKRLPDGRSKGTYDLGQILAVAGNRVVVNQGAKLVIADRADGSVKGDSALPASPVASGLAVAGGLVVVACADGSVVALR